MVWPRLGRWKAQSKECCLEANVKMARLEGETSNDLFETLEDWNAILEQLTPQYDEVSP